MNSAVTRTSIPDVLIFEPQVFEDARGHFMESYNQRDFAETTGLDVKFVQDNQSSSVHNVLRGLHYQMRQAQGKLVRVLRGEIFDVAVDLRKNSPHFGKSVSVNLSAENRRQLWIPAGFAHGFLVLSEVAECFYKTTDYYNPESERTLAWNDPELRIHWPTLSPPILSDKDREGRNLGDAEVYG